MINPPRSARSIFEEALDCGSASDRSAYLDRVCVDAPELRKRVEDLLRAHDEAGSFLDKPAVAPPLPKTIDHLPSSSSNDLPDTVDEEPQTDERSEVIGPGSWVGAFRIVRAIGRGGMGTVYEAEQERPLRRRVALKIIKPEHLSEQSRARFQAERQALTRMDHVNVARVFEAGETSSRQPYFVMEYVEGKTLTKHCDGQALSIRDRLELFVAICEGVQHAHQKGIIHRDLKPGNVLVSERDGKSIPKIIDFGLAKATDDSLTDDEALTQFGTILGTPEYVSPEQADFHSTSGVDTRTDVYSLGVMLYELLTGTTPLGRETIRKTNLFETLKRIQEEEPPKPSARVARSGERTEEIARQRQSEPDRLAKMLRGELDLITMKALQKDREQRYDSAGALARDVRRYLDDEPVEACPPSRSYRLAKFARKNRGLLMTAAAFVAVLLLGISGLAVGIVVARTQQFRAELAEGEMREGYLLAHAAVEAAGRKNVQFKGTEAEILREAIERHQGVLSETTTNEKALRTVADRHFLLGDVSVMLGEAKKAQVHYAEAAGRYERLTEMNPTELSYPKNLARSRYQQASLLRDQGKMSEAESAYLSAIAVLKGMVEHDPDHVGNLVDLADAWNNLGTIWRDQGKLAQAEQAFRDTIALNEKLSKRTENRSTLGANYHNLGNVLREQNHPTQAIESYTKAIQLLTLKELTSQDEILFLRNAHWDRANARGQLRQHDEAISDWQKAIELDPGGARSSLRQFLAVERIEQQLQHQRKPDGKLLYQAARVNAQAMQGADSQGEPSLKRRYRTRAFELLTQTREAGYFQQSTHLKQLLAEQSFESLPAAEWRAFLATLGVR